MPPLSTFQLSRFWVLGQGKDCKVNRKRYSREFQRMAVERMRSSDNIGDLAKDWE